MSIVLDGTNGISDVDGSASTPAIRGTDSNTGIFFPAADTIAFAEGGAEAMRIDSSGNVTINNNTSYRVKDTAGNNIRALIMGTDNVVYSGCFDTPTSGGSYVLMANGSERARITSDGEFCINTTGIGSTKLRVYQNGNSNDNSYSGIDILKGSTNTTTSQVFQRFFTNAGSGGSGSITANGASAATFTAYSDRRLKENIQDLSPQLDNICRLKPSEFDYIGYSEGQGHQIGFIAQDMQEVYPDVVAADGEGMLQIAGWSKTEARLVKAIQELKAITDAQATRIETLEAQNAAFEARLAALEAK